MGCGPCTCFGLIVTILLFVFVLMIPILAKIRLNKVYFIVAGFTFLAFFVFTCICRCTCIKVYRRVPFKYFWSQWTCRSRRFHRHALNKTAEFDGSCTTSNLCIACSDLVNGSRLLTGAVWIYTSRVEWHDYQIPFEDLEDARAPFCHLCTLLRDNLSQEVLPHQPRNDCGYLRIPRILRVKIWEGQKTLWYESDQEDHNLYMQLYDGEDPLGGYLKIESELRRPHVADLGISTGSGACISQAKNWIHNCALKHELCTEDITSGQFRPTRLLWVGNDRESSDLHLQLTSPGDPPVQFLALSHCWGGHIDYMLTSESHHRMLQHIEYSHLARNFQDAVTLTRKLGFSYLWIDSLCIIQGSVKDWEYEAQKMASVYAAAFCTISSCGSPDSQGGCFHNRNPLQNYPCHLLSSRSLTGTRSWMIRPRYLAETDTFSAEVESSPLSKRSWAFQERLLSRRILHFGKGYLFFECNTLVASERLNEGEKHRLLQVMEEDETESVEDLPVVLNWFVKVTMWVEGKTHHRDIADMRDPKQIVTGLYDKARYGYRGAFNTLRLQPVKELEVTEQQQLHVRWFELVSMYTGGNLTYATDRSVGISGIAKIIQAEKDLDYLSGLWRHHFFSDLMWMLHDDETPQKRPDRYRAPSWSWIAVDGKVRRNIFPAALDDTAPYRSKQQAKVHEIIVTEAGVSKTNATALVDGGYLDLECRIVAIGPISSCWKIRNERGVLHFPNIEPNVEYWMSFYPDTVLPDPTTELYCARIWISGWSSGLVLRRVEASRREGEIDKYERAGVFEVVNYTGTSFDIFDDSKLEVIRII